MLVECLTMLIKVVLVEAVAYMAEPVDGIYQAVVAQATLVVYPVVLYKMVFELEMVMLESH